MKTLSGRTSTIAFKLDDSVDVLKHKIYDREHLDPAEQRLVYGGKQLDDGRCLRDYGVQADSTIHLALRIRGGMALYCHRTSLTHPMTLTSQISMTVKPTSQEVEKSTSVHAGGRDMPSRWMESTSLTYGWAALMRPGSGRSHTTAQQSIMQPLLTKDISLVNLIL